jgi:hypothetical protein
MKYELQKFQSVLEGTAFSWSPSSDPRVRTSDIDVFNNDRWIWLSFVSHTLYHLEGGMNALSHLSAAYTNHGLAGLLYPWVHTSFP